MKPWTTHIGEALMGIPQALFSAPARPFVGAIAGGIYGGVTSENFSESGRFRDILTGAAVGGGIGLASTPPMVRMMKGAAKGAVGGVGRSVKNAMTQGMRRKSKAISVAVKGDIRGAMRAGMERNEMKRMVLEGGKTAATMGGFAFHNPKTALAIAGGTFGLGALAYTGYKNMGGNPPSAADTLVFMRRNRLSSTGRTRFEQSTEGLTQAMYRGRHGGG